MNAVALVGFALFGVVLVALVVVWRALARRAREEEVEALLREEIDGLSR